MPGATTYQCPNCNGVMTYNAATGLVTCEFCGSEFEAGQREAAIPVAAAPAEAGATDHVTTVEEFLEHAPWENSANARAYSCPSCGAEVVADQSTVSTACPYCGNNMLVAGIAGAGNMPRYALPFTVTREQAEARMREHFQHKWYLSRAFDASLQHMQGVYVPYHLYDIRVWGRADYIGYWESPSDDDGNSVKKYYGIKRAGYAAFESIPIDGSSKMPDAHMDAIAPFDFAKLRDFDAGYLAGYLAEVADEDAETCLPRAEAQARTSFAGDLESDARRERGVDGIDETVASEVNAKVEVVRPCVLPVWLAHCTWNGNQMLFAVNGDTGKCVGDLPIDGKRRAATIAVTAIVLAAIALAFLVFVMEGEDAGSFLVGAAIFIALATMLVDGHFRGQMKTAVETEDAHMSYNGEGLVVTERWRSKKGYLNRAKALDSLNNN